MRRVVQRKLELGELFAMGETIHKFSNNIVGAKVMRGRIARGDEFYAIHRRGCYKTKVLSIQIGPTSHENLDTSDGQEIGIRFDTPLNVKSELLQILPAKSATIAEQIETAVAIEEADAVLDMKPEISEEGMQDMASGDASSDDGLPEDPVA